MVEWKLASSVPHKTYVLVARKSGYVGTKWEYLTAQYDPDYKGWVDVSNDRLTDSGEDPLYWTEVPNPPVPIDLDYLKDKMKPTVYRKPEPGPRLMGRTMPCY